MLVVVLTGASDGTLVFCPPGELPVAFAEGRAMSLDDATRSPSGTRDGRAVGGSLVEYGGECIRCSLFGRPSGFFIYLCWRVPDLLQAVDTVVQELVISVLALRSYGPPGGLRIVQLSLVARFCAFILQRFGLSFLALYHHSIKHSEIV